MSDNKLQRPAKAPEGVYTTDDEKKEKKPLKDKIFWAPSDKNKRVFMDVSIDGSAIGRLIIKLFDDIVPKTCENFRALCTGEKGLGIGGYRLHYLGTYIHNITPGFMCQGGDFVTGGGVGGPSIYGTFFDDENHEVSHAERGIISMVNKGPNTNGSQFFITFTDTKWLDNTHVAFGKILNVSDILKKIEDCGTPHGVTRKKVKIDKCGQLLKPMITPQEYKTYLDDLEKIRQKCIKKCEKEAFYLGWFKRDKKKKEKGKVLNVWLEKEEISKKWEKKGIVAECVEANVLDYDAVNRDKENPDIYIGLVVLKFKKGYPKIRKLEISEIQKRLAGPKNGGGGADNQIFIATNISEESSLGVKTSESIDEEKI